MLKGVGLHRDIGPGDRFHWNTSTGWIMWNVQVSGLVAGATAVLYDGNPGYPDQGVLWRFVSRGLLGCLGSRGSPGRLFPLLQRIELL